MKRTLFSAAGAAVVTFGLGLSMMRMIAVEFTAQDKQAAQTYDINPQVDEPPVITRVTLPDPFREVEPPPPLTPFDVTSADLPREPQPRPLPDPTPKEFKDFLDPQMIDVAITDKDAQPIFQSPPIMPPRAERSGYCDMRLNVSPEGETFSIEVISCTDNVFRRASIKSAQKWRYAPKIKDGIAVTRTGVETRIRFDLLDARGERIPA